MKKSLRKQFEELSIEVFGHKNTYKAVLKGGFRYLDATQAAYALKVQHFTEAQLMQTMLDTLKNKQEKADELQVQQEKSGETSDVPPGSSTPSE